MKTAYRQYEGDPAISIEAGGYEVHMCLLGADCDGSGRALVEFSFGGDFETITNVGAFTTMRKLSSLFIELRGFCCVHQVRHIVIQCDRRRATLYRRYVGRSPLLAGIEIEIIEDQ